MSYVTVSADFPSVTTEQRKKIYECIKEKGWTKVIEPGRDIDTVWYAQFTDAASEQGCINTTKADFVDCSKPYCNPKLVMQWGPNKPAFHGLV